MALAVNGKVDHQASSSLEAEKAFSHLVGEFISHNPKVLQNITGLTRREKVRVVLDTPMMRCRLLSQF